LEEEQRSRRQSKNTKDLIKYKILNRGGGKLASVQTKTKKKKKKGGGRRSDLRNSSQNYFDDM